MGLPTAISTRLRFLYHYTRFVPEYLERMLCSNRIYFSNPGDFNDPWDCSVSYKDDKFDDPGIIEEHIQYYLRVTKLQMPEITERDLEERAEFYRSNPNKLREAIPLIATAVQESINSYWRVFCLSSKRDNELMWAHYGHKHKGICIQFNVENHLFCGALKISYRREYPRNYIIDDEADAELIPLTTKSESWEYEDEYRLIARVRSDPFYTGGTIETDDNFVDIPNTAISGVIVGCMCANEDIETIKHLIK